jgi:hypothetical protein
MQNVACVFSSNCMGQTVNKHRERLGLLTVTLKTILSDTSLTSEKKGNLYSQSCNENEVLVFSVDRHLESNA